MTPSATNDAASGTHGAVKVFMDLGALTFYAAMAGLLFLGWRIKEYQYLSAENGLGYALGITGGSMMLLLLLYSARKRIRSLRWLGGVRPLFRVHMAFGVIGPVLILFHANFSLGSTNSTVALVCMLLVAGSGLVGRYLYSLIHQGLYGRRVALKELRDTADQKRAGLGSLIAAVPALSSRLNELDTAVRHEGGGLIALMLQERKIMTGGRRMRKLCAALARKAAGKSDRHRRIIRQLDSDTKAYVKACQRVARLQIYERLFGLWHIFHLPLFMMLVVTGVVHVFAVHIY